MLATFTPTHPSLRETRAPREALPSLSDPGTVHVSRGGTERAMIHSMIT